MDTETKASFRPICFYPAISKSVLLLLFVCPLNSKRRANENNINAWRQWSLKANAWTKRALCALGKIEFSAYFFSFLPPTVFGFSWLNVTTSAPTTAVRRDPVTEIQLDVKHFEFVVCDICPGIDCLSSLCSSSCTEKMKLRRPVKTPLVILCLVLLFTFWMSSIVSACYVESNGETWVLISQNGVAVAQPLGPPFLCLLPSFHISMNKTCWSWLFPLFVCIFKGRLYSPNVMREMKEEKAVYTVH